MANKIELSFEDLELIGKALMSHRWRVEKQEGENPEFHHAASLADRLACNHNGATLVFNTNLKKES
jgi:hypothetical protein